MIICKRLVPLDDYLGEAGSSSNNMYIYSSPHILLSPLSPLSPLNSVSYVDRVRHVSSVNSLNSVLSL